MTVRMSHIYKNWDIPWTNSLHCITPFQDILFILQLSVILFFLYSIFLMAYPHRFIFSIIIIIFFLICFLSFIAATSNSSKHHHKWVGPSGHLLITVDANGLGNFRTVQAAVNSIPINNTKNVLIHINAGYYMYVTPIIWINIFVWIKSL